MIDMNQSKRLRDGFTKLRSAASKFSAESIINAISHELNKGTSYKDSKGMTPHALLLILRITLEYGKYGETRRMRSISRQQFIDLVNSWHEANEHVPMPSEFESVELWLRVTAFQQFWLQSTLKLSDVSRQHCLFYSSDGQSSISRMFYKAYGVELNDFLDFLFMLSAYALQEDYTRGVEASWFIKSTNFSEDVVEKCLSILGGTFYEHRKKLHSMKSSSDYEKMYVPSPLRKYPLLYVPQEDKYLIFSKALLTHYIINGVYEMLSDKYGGQFREKFGVVFEKYVDRNLKYADVPLDCGDEVLKGANRKSVDFVIHGEGVKVFIDAKGVEMADKGKTAISSSIVSNRLKSSVNKGVQQGYASNAVYRNISDVDYEPFLVVVTYQKMYLGSGEDYANLVGKKLISDLKKSYPTDEWIPEANMFFMDIAELESLCALIREKKHSVPEVFKTIRDASKNAHKKKFTFGQYIDDFEASRTSPSFLLEEFEVLSDRVMSYLK